MRTLLLALVFVAGLAAPPSTALATDANGNHNTYVWVLSKTQPWRPTEPPQRSTDKAV